MRFYEPLILSVIVREEKPLSEEQLEQRKIKRIINSNAYTDEDDDFETEDSVQQIYFFCINYLVKADNDENKCIVCAGLNEDVIDMPIEKLLELIKEHKQYLIK